MWGSIQHADLLQLKQIYLFVKRHNFVNNEIIDTQYYQNLWSGNLLGSRVELVDARSLLLLLLESEINRAQIWLSSLEIAPDVGYSYVVKRKHSQMYPIIYLYVYELLSLCNSIHLDGQHLLGLPGQSIQN